MINWFRLYQHPESPENTRNFWKMLKTKSY